MQVGIDEPRRDKFASGVYLALRSWKVVPWRYCCYVSTVDYDITLEQFPRMKSQNSSMSNYQTWGARPKSNQSQLHELLHSYGEMSASRPRVVNWHGGIHSVAF